MSKFGRIVMVAIGTFCVTIVGLVASPARACQPSSPWEPESISTDAPDCLRLEGDALTYEDVLNFDNECDRDFSVDPLACNAADCDGPGVEVAANTYANLSAYKLGIDDSDFSDGDTFNATLAWTDEDDEGTIELTVRYRERPNSCPDNGCSVPASSSPHPMDELLLLFVMILSGAIFLFRRR